MDKSHLRGSSLYWTAGLRPKVVSFSGIDGAGKTTQIDALCAWLREENLSVRRLTFWDDVAVLGSARESLSRVVFKGETGVGSPAKPVHRRDKNVRTWYTAVARLLLYFLDAMSLSLVCLRLCSDRDGDVIIFDRYLYDELANLDAKTRWARAYIRCLLKFTRCPDVAFLLDADPEAACARKPEYPLNFVHENRAAYFGLTRYAPGINIIPALRADQVASQVQELVRLNLATRLFGNPVRRGAEDCALPVDVEAGTAPAAATNNS